MALKIPFITRILGGRATRETTSNLALLAGEGAATRLGLSGRAASAWTRLARLGRGLPGPLALAGAVILIAPALLAPDWFAARLALLDHLPEAVWWLAGAGISLAFGTRFQASEQAFARELIEQATRPDPLATAATGTDAALAITVEEPRTNPPLEEWLRLNRDG